MPMSGRPLDVLEAALDEPVAVNLKDGTARYGLLGGYDQHMNVVLDPAPDRTQGELEDLHAEPIRDTTVIRGDNVVSIQV